MPGRRPGLAANRAPGALPGPEGAGPRPRLRRRVGPPVRHARAELPQRMDAASARAAASALPPQPSLPAMKPTVLALCALALLWGCVTPQQYDAASDIRAFLIAVRDGDRQTFDEHVDRGAL